MLASGAAIVVSGGWWVAIVALWPVGSRPFIDGSPDNSILNLIVGYNGLGRIFGASGPGPGGGGGGGGGGANFSGPTGVLRLFDSEMGAQASWLLPAAVLALAVGLWMCGRAPRTDRRRAALLLWGGWLVVSGVVFSFGSGVIHTYYTVALVPAIAALIAITGSMLWQERKRASARIVAALAVSITASWSWVLLDRTPQWESWMRVVIPASAAIAVIGLLAAPAVRRFRREASLATAVMAAVACLSGPVAYSGQTITTAHTGSIPSAGPGASISGGPGGAPGGKLAGGGPGSALRGSGPLGRPGALGLPGVAPTGAGTRAPKHGALPGGSQLFGGSPPAGGGGGQRDVSAAVKEALESDAGRYRWVAAVSGSQTAASLELATGGEPVMAIGGFNNEGGRLTLAQFERYVKQGEIHYYFASTGPGGGMGASSISSITSWVQAHFKSVEIGGQTVYDLTQANT
jgi:hypothetical protein